MQHGFVELDGWNNMISDLTLLGGRKLCDLQRLFALCCRIDRGLYLSRWFPRSFFQEELAESAEHRTDKHRLHCVQPHKHI